MADENAPSQRTILGRSKIFTPEVINDIHMKSELGRYRSDENGLPIDASGKLTGTASGASFTGAVDAESGWEQSWEEFLKDGEAYLNLAKLLRDQGKTAEAKAAAQQALDKGVAKPAEAKEILSN